MIKKTSLLASLALLAGGASLDAQAAETDMLGYIPANAPYFMATRETLDQQEVFAFYQRTMLLGDGLERDLEALREQRRNEPNEQAQAFLSLVIALGEEFEDIDTLEDVHARGINVSPNVALYGLGILPVMRFELEDDAAFRDTFERVVERAGLTPRIGRVEGTDYWRITPEDDVELMLAIVDGQALVSLIPGDASDELLAQILGKRLPDESMEESGEIAEIERSYGFTPLGTGQIRTARVLSELGSPRHPATRALLDALGEEPLDLTACQADIDRLTGRFPGLTVGSRAYDLRGRTEVNMIVQTDEEVVRDLRRLVTPVPGLGQRDGLASFGLGLDLSVLLELVDTYARQIREAPFSCDELQQLNTLWDETSALTSDPMAMMIAPALSGLNARIDRLYLAKGGPMATGLLTLASSNPMTLLENAAAFLPELSEVMLTPNGEPRRLKSRQLPAQVSTLYAAMSDSALALGVGLDDPSTLTNGLQAPVADDDLLLNIFATGDLYTALADLLIKSPQEDVSEEDIAQLKHYGEIYDSLEVRVSVGDEGLETSFAMDMAD
ncbi:hypothetical protein [Halomonas sp. GD1P12]|uniref:hypothetical protein n=1 Tax=Halomonas sp. GD1P12 TaxID=2982691 RepID=UPI0021E3F254|nr:hypothetical protein [Halomonas sp. GD1P12]UYG00834.1 hypothetical protein OCT39_04510 [Halomonas sp. GD1P12]